MTARLRVLVVAGARPNFVKVAPILDRLRRSGHEGILVHTGQHYDAAMSDALLSDLSIDRPRYHLGVGSGSHAVQTARVMTAFEPVLHDVRPDWVVVVGDVNSTIACALVASKLRDAIGCRVAHVEAGLRSGDWRMPEEVNRVLTDRLADLLLTPSDDALPNLLAEGISADRIVFVGNAMIDTLRERLAEARGRNLAERLALPRGAFALATLHRPSNVDRSPTLETLLSSLDTLSERMPVVLPMHPRTRSSINRLGLDWMLRRLRVLDSLGYLDMLSLMDAAAVAITDSGGVQEETTVLGVPCVTVRESTERPVTISTGTNRLAPWPLTRSGILETCDAALRVGRREVGACAPSGWDGHASERIVTALERLVERAVAPRVGLVA